MNNKAIITKLSGAAGIKAKLPALRQAFPEIHFSLEELIEGGAAGAARY
jgi:hypothetical protein